MKKIILALLLMPLVGIAQTTVKDSMVMGPGYANQVFYSLSKGTVSTSPMNNWHISMLTNPYEASIWANEAEGVSVYVDTFTTNFSKVDTTGMTKKWPKLYNPDTSWSVGAFNTYNSGGFDYGWGYYDYSLTHNIVGTRVYVLKINYGSGNVMYRKIKFEVRQAIKSGKLNAGDMVFHYASLDSTVDKRDTLRYDKWKNKLTAYYDLVGDSFVSREPDMTNWDLTMSHYITDLGGGFEYDVTGVLQNYYSNMFKFDTSNVLVAKAAHIDVNTVKAPTSAGAYKTQINTIGYDFAHYSGSYTLVDSLVYFVKTTNGAIYKLHMTYFVGSTDGKLVFDKTEVAYPNAVNDITVHNSLRCFVAGNPVTSNSLQLVTDNTLPLQEATINIIDITGKVIKSYAVGSISATLHAWDINVSDVANGVYLIQLTDNKNIQAVTRAVIAR